MSRSVLILTVHGIGPTSRTLDPGEDRTWVRLNSSSRCSTLSSAGRDVQLTFDDGNASDIEIALPRLLERGLSAEFFVCAGLLGEPGGWLAQMSASCTRQGCEWVRTAGRIATGGGSTRAYAARSSPMLVGFWPS